MNAILSRAASRLPFGTAAALVAVLPALTAISAELPWTGPWTVHLGATSGNSVRAFGASITGNGQVADTMANVADAYVRATADAFPFLSDSASTGLDFNRTFKPAANKYYQVTLSASLTGSQTINNAGGANKTSVQAQALLGLASGLPASYVHHGGGPLNPQLPPGVAAAVATGVRSKTAWVAGGGDYKILGSLSAFSSTTNGSSGIDAESDFFNVGGFKVDSSIVEKELPFTTFDVTVNSYNNSGVVKADAIDYVKRINEILRPARIVLNLAADRIKIGATAGDDGSDGGTANDGDFTDKEGRKAVAEGAKEVKNGVNGLNLIFARTPDVGSTTPGWSFHRVPAVVGKKRATAQQTAETMAHEILHTLTLAEKYNLDFTNQSDDHGHAPNNNNDGGKSGNGNIMAPSNYRAGTHIQPLQIVKILNDGIAGRWGKQVDKPAKDAIGAKIPMQKGGDADPLGDHLALMPNYLDLTGVSLYSLADDDVMEGLIDLADLFPDVDSFSASYSLEFDSLPGVGSERRLQIDVGRTTLGGSIDAVAHMFDLTSLGSDPISLPDVLVLASRHALDLDEDRGYAKHQLQFSFDKTLLGAVSPGSPIPFRLVSSDGLSEADELLADLDLNWWNNQPTLDLGVPQGQPGQFTPVTVSGLTPDTEFDLFFENELLLTAMTDSNGAFGGGFVIPGQTLDSFGFVRAIDVVGRSAFNVIGIVPEPAALMLIGVAALGCWSQRRRLD